MRIPVFAHDANPGLDKPLFGASRVRAVLLIQRKEVRVVKYNSKRAGLQLLGRTRPRGTFGGGNQGDVYEMAAIETHPQIVQGGLTRTEHQPSAKPGILTWGHVDDRR